MTDNPRLPFDDHPEPRPLSREVPPSPPSVVRPHGGGVPSSPVSAGGGIHSVKPRPITPGPVNDPPPPTFDAEAGRIERDAGMQLAADARAELLEQAREVARQVAREKGTVTCDDVRREFDPPLGNAWGSLFKTDEWEFAGEWRRSEIVSNHRRAMCDWRLRKGER